MNKLFIIIVSQFLIYSNLLAAAPLAVDDLILSAKNTTKICYPLANDSDSDHDQLQLLSYDTTTGNGGFVTDNGNGALVYTPGNDFTGLDSFTYTISDGNNTDTATVSINVNDIYDIDSARSAILNGVSILADPSGASGCVAYGPTAYSIGNYGGENRSDPIAAAATLGAGRVIAMPDHQWLNMNSYGDTADTGTFYINAIKWLTGTSSKTIKIVVHNSVYNNADIWLRSQGYTNVVKSSNYQTELSDADILIGWLGSSMSQSNIDVIIDFARNGGALFLSDYGPGYDMWWTGTGIKNAPGNLILRHAGIGFASEGGGSLNISRSYGQTTAEDVIAMLESSSGYSSSELNIGGTVLGRMFDVLKEGDNLLARMDAHFYARINAIMPTPNHGVSDSFEKALLRRECSILENIPVEEMSAHRTAASVYGHIPGDAQRVTKINEYNISEEGKDTRGNDSSIWLSTGLYAVPGELVTIDLSSSVMNKGLKAKINGDWNNVSSRPTYYRMPYGTSTEFDLDRPEVPVANPYGGLIYIVVPENTVTGEFEVTISNAIEAPTFIFGQDTNEDWTTVIRNKPAPYAELIAENLIISVPKDQVITLEQPEELMTFWNDGIAAQDDLANLTGNRTRPTRMYSMVMTAWGSGYASYPIGGWGWNFGDYEALEAGGCWGAYHESGHLHQSGYWTDGRTGEVTVNIFTMAAIEAVCDSGMASDGWNRMWDPSRRIGMYEDAVADGGFNNTGLGERLNMYVQLKEVFGWDAFKAVFQSYLDDEASNSYALPYNDQQEWDQFMTRFSRQVGYDLSPFFIDWDFGVSSSAISSLSDLPEWNMLETINETYSVPSGGSISISDPSINDYSFQGAKNLVSVGTPHNGTIITNGTNSWTYTAKSNFEGVDIVPYTVQNGYGNLFTGEIKITVTGKELVAYYTFDNTHLAGNTIKDMSGPKKINAANISAKSGVSGYVDQAIYCTGNNSYAEIPALNLNSNHVTLSAWIKRSGSQQSFSGILFSRAGATTAGLNLIGTTNDLGYHWNGTSNTYNFDSNLNVPDNEWVFIALVVEPAKATLYLNDESAVNIVSHSAEEFNGITYIGRDYSYRSFKGYIDEITIWNRSLDASEIAELYTNGRKMINSLPEIPLSINLRPALEGLDYLENLSSFFSDPEGDSLVFSKVSGPSWINVAPDGSITGTPGIADIGIEPIIVQAVDQLNGISQGETSVSVFDMHWGDQGLDDFAAIAKLWLNAGCTDYPPCGGCDLNLDQKVDFDDLNILCQNWIMLNPAYK